MIKIFSRLVFSALLAVLPLSQAVADGSRLHSILESGVLRVGTTGDWDPMSVRNPATNQYQGFDIDVAKALAEDMGVKLKLVPADWKTLVNGVVANKYDMSTSASINMGRAKVAGYSQSYFSVGTVPLVRKADLEKFSNWDDINKGDVKVAVTLGTVFEQEAKEYFPAASLKAVEAPARDFQELLSGRANVALTSNLEASKLVAKYPQLAVLPFPPRKAKPLAILLPQDDQVWINYINHWITFRKAQGFFTELEARWMP
ncbi:transporter substrate-binding domain-containing protein [Parendozoicomonas haliclonae]|uniref:Cyclohexadienyl dehydratase n=1 Tax=Parendozoicomonas haliclonae TaxID=1960125 RepID=A0A1X7ANZ9_9GAMM|nr:transporter substrate-binding domain-containing protein [Parendozoicomonas haliclonae]SMA49985.1 Cyclohexadienyl dehydratase precursor [Parendozoicomonas haliclonae]